MGKEATKRGRAVVRTLAVAWLLYGAFLDANPGPRIVFVVLGLLLLLVSEVAMEALASHSNSTREKYRAIEWY